MTRSPDRDAPQRDITAVSSEHSTSSSWAGIAPVELAGIAVRRGRDRCRATNPRRPLTSGTECLQRLARRYLAAFSDQRFLVNEQIAEGDFVTTRWTGTGTNDGEMTGMPPTGKSAVVQGITINRFRDGAIVESWGCWDTLGMMQQLGVVPAAHPAAH